MGVEVPPAHVGFNRDYKNNKEVSVQTYGALIEWFYDGTKDGYIPGGQIMLEVIANFDRKKGEQHNFESIINLGIDHLRTNFFTVDTISTHWAGVLTLDTLIANTDRHQDNWGVTIKFDGNETLKEIKCSPDFDNGTAMDYGVKEGAFYQFHDEMRLKSRLENSKRAKHHMKWTLKDETFLNFYEFMAKFVLKYPNAKDTVLNCLSFDRQQAEEILKPLCGIVDDPKYQLTQKRLAFTLDMIFKRKKLLEEALGL